MKLVDRLLIGKGGTSTIDHGLNLYEDGTLQITMPKGTMVRRVLVDEEGSHFCEVMYPETGSGISKEPTYEQVLEYCNKRCLALVSEELLAKLPSAQPEIIRCKNCKHRDSNDCPMYYEEWIEVDEGDGYFDTDNIIHDRTTDEGFCHCAELRGEQE